MLVHCSPTILHFIKIFKFSGYFIQIIKLDCFKDHVCRVRQDGDMHIVMFCSYLVSWTLFAGWLPKCAMDTCIECRQGGYRRVCTSGRFLKKYIYPMRDVAHCRVRQVVAGFFQRRRMGALGSFEIAFGLWFRICLFLLNINSLISAVLL